MDARHEHRGGDGAGAGEDGAEAEGGVDEGVVGLGDLV
jgi:hypothetical protein